MRAAPSLLRCLLLVAACAAPGCEGDMRRDSGGGQGDGGNPGMPADELDGRTLFDGGCADAGDGGSGDGGCADTGLPDGGQEDGDAAP